MAQYNDTEIRLKHIPAGVKRTRGPHAYRARHSSARSRCAELCLPSLVEQPTDHVLCTCWQLSHGCSHWQLPH